MMQKLEVRARRRKKKRAKMLPAAARGAWKEKSPCPAWRGKFEYVVRKFERQGTADRAGLRKSLIRRGTPARRPGGGRGFCLAWLARQWRLPRSRVLEQGAGGKGARVQGACSRFSQEILLRGNLRAKRRMRLTAERKKVPEYYSRGRGSRYSTHHSRLKRSPAAERRRCLRASLWRIPGGIPG